MQTFENSHGVNETHFKTEATVYCPIGKDYYKADIEVWVYGQSRIVDFLGIYDFCVNELNGKNLTHEAVAATVFDKMQKAFQPEHLKVKVFSHSPLWAETVKEG